MDFKKLNPFELKKFPKFTEEDLKKAEEEYIAEACEIRNYARAHMMDRLDENGNNIVKHQEARRKDAAKKYQEIYLSLHPEALTKFLEGILPELPKE